MGEKEAIRDLRGRGGKGEGRYDQNTQYTCINSQRINKILIDLQFFLF